MGKLTTHVLDTAQESPARALPSRSTAWTGTPAPFLRKRRRTGTAAPMRRSWREKLRAGTYQLVFHVGAYFRSEGFLDAVPIRFKIADPAAHYHVPLLCSPWSYATYRGS